MASDNTVLNSGSGGETIRSLADSSNLNWPVGVTAYATTISAGANVIQIVTPTAGLPVQQEAGATFAVSAASLPLPTGVLFSRRLPDRTCSSSRCRSAVFWLLVS